MIQQTLPGRVLVVDDDPSIRDTLARSLEASRYTVKTARDGATALEAMHEFHPEVVVLDLGLPDVEGLDLIPHIQQVDDLIGVVVFTGTSDISVVVEAMRRGAENFLVKPVTIDTLEQVLERSLEAHRRNRRHRALVRQADRSERTTLIGSSGAMDRVRSMITQVADTNATVLLMGESGTGKGLAAEDLHQQSRRSREPFLDLNCASLSPTLLESELFGHEPGAYTDARKSKPGLLEVANNGSVFLDEIAEMPLEVQGKLLKTLEDGRFRRVGGVRDIQVDVRLIAATNHDLKQAVNDGLFRTDLYYRLNVFAIEIPPLRDRPGDVLELAHHFLRDLNAAMGTDVDGLAAEAASALQVYHWPGNVRELRNVIERAVILARTGTIQPHHFPSDLHPLPISVRGAPMKPLSEVEREHISQILEATGGNIKRSAEVLQVSRTTLYNKIKAHGIELQS